MELQVSQAFSPKYRRKLFFEEKGLEIREILRTLCAWKRLDIKTKITIDKRKNYAIILLVAHCLPIRKKEKGG